MKPLLLLSGFIFFCLAPVLTAQCPQIHTYLTTQTQIDSFQFHYPNCTELDRLLYVKGSDIENLHGLSVLTLLRGIEVDSTQILNLEGLQNITDLSSIILSNNPLLTDVSAIGGITDLRWHFSLVNCDAMVDLNGLGLDSVRYCIIKDNDALTSLHGLESLTYVMYVLSVINNPSLPNLRGLQNISEVSNELVIRHNPRIKNLDGLGGILSVGHTIWIDRNDSLKSLAGLEHVHIIDHSHSVFMIEHNPQLEFCHTPPICEYLETGEVLYFIENATGCNSRDEVIEQCMFTTTNEPKEKQDYFLYPNPAADLLYIESKDLTAIDHVALFNQLGLEVFSMDQYNGPIEISHLPQGLYYVCVNNDKTSNPIRLVKI